MRLHEQLTAVVDAGGDKFFIDLNQIETPTLPIIQLVLSAIQAANKLSIRHAIVASDDLKAKFLGYAESQTWLFATSFEDASAQLATPAAAGAAH